MNQNRIAKLPFTLGLAALMGMGVIAADAQYFQTNLVSDISGKAKFLDPNLKNPWGIAASGTSPFWVANQGTNTSTLYNTAGTPQALVVSVPGAVPPSGPTGVVFNGNADFALPTGGGSRFIFSTLQGTIAAWNGAQGTTAVIKQTVANAVFTGLGIGAGPGGGLLYAANFRGGVINVFDKNFASITVPGGFIDPNLPSGYTPYNVQNLGGKLYVTYAKLDPTQPNFTSLTGGIVNVFDQAGNFLQRIGSDGPLNAPWGVAIAPSNFGAFSNSLLVGNFADGRISAFDPLSGSFRGQLSLGNGQFFSEPGLWGLQFGNGGNGGRRDFLYFASGINGERNGLFGSLEVPEPGSVAMFAAMGLTGLGFVIRRRK